MATLKVDAGRWLTLVVLCVLFGGCRSRSELAGSYVGKGSGSYRLQGGFIPIPSTDDVLTVRRTAQHYQHSEYDLVIHGCTVHVSAGPEAWSGNGDCTFDLPSVGPVPAVVSGGISRDPEGASADDVHLSLYGSGTGNVQAFSYQFRGKPRGGR
ncbi:MAG: hypothetical protein HOO96_22500 [Polyangiaceae bacterium]|nr:hypothetical protein [Polyangiaceae bacterium]